MAGSGNATVIVRRGRKHGAHSHHGGAWKVAYADFVTAMMAFFLMLWLLNATSEEQRRGIADYFSPVTLSNATTSGAEGILGGITITRDGSARDERAPFDLQVAPPPEESGPATEEDLERLLAERERAAFEEAMEELRAAIESVPDLAELADNLIVDQTPEGMRLQIVDQQGTEMFPRGSAVMYDRTARLLTLVAHAIERMPNRIAVKGHTDSVPYRGEGGYSNWELSSDRANASRRALVSAGLPEARISYVAGKAETEHLNSADPLSPQNRRISIILLHQRDKPWAAAPLPASERAPAQPINPPLFGG